MAERMDDTKAIKRKFDDETVEQLVENRFVSDKKASQKPKRKAKKKKNYALSALITVLAFVLVFVIFFIGSYIIFTASPQPIEEDIKASDAKDKNEDLAEDYDQDKTPAPAEKSEDKTFDDELTKEDDIDVKPSGKKDNTIEDEKSSSTDNDDKQTSSSTDTSKKPQAAAKPQTTTKPQTTPKPQTQPAAKPSAPAADTKPSEGNTSAPNSSTDVVKKNEESEAIILD